MNYMQNYTKTRNNRQLGTYYEAYAKNYLIEKGYEIIQANFRCRIGEIDMIARDGAYTVFIEIKYRSNQKCGLPRESVTYHKRQKILAVAKYYLMYRRLGEIPCRFDVIEIFKEQINHIENAFMEG